MTNTAELLTRAKALIEELAEAILATPEVTPFSIPKTANKTHQISSDLRQFAEWRATPQGEEFWRMLYNAFQALSRGEEAEFNRLVAEAVKCHPTK